VASEVTREDEIGFGWKLGVVAGLATLAVAWAPFWGIEHVPFRALWGDADDATVYILWQLRIPRVFMAFLAGSALSTGGMVFQAVLRNRLATPFTLGVSSGAALGAALSLQFGWTFALLGVSSASLSAVIGAAFSIGLVYLLTAHSRRGTSTGTMLLAGVAVCFLFSCLSLLLQYASNSASPYRMLRWTLGGLGEPEVIVQFRDVWGVLPFVVSGCLIVWYLLLELNLLTTGEEFAFSRGMNVGQTKAILFFAVSLMVGAAVAVCGPIGFVGLIAPQICRWKVGADHRRLYPATLLFGGALLVICDTAARTLMAPTELPVGIITALLGAPFFLWLLVSRRKDFGAS
jgi:iron complex transport system permease protein